METVDSQGAAKKTHLRVGPLLIDLRFRRIIRQDATVELPQRVFDLLLFFLYNPHVLHTRDALFERIWPEVLVEDSNLTQSIWMVRRALGNECKSWICTVAKGGYVFDPPMAVEFVDVLQAQMENGPSGQPVEAQAEVDVKAPVAVAMPIQTTLSQSAPALWTLGRRLAAFAALLCVAILVGFHASKSPLDTDHKPVRVVLLQVGNGETKAGSDWPAQLLETWLAWKIDNLPEAIRLTQEDMTADELTAPPHAILLITGHPPGRPDLIFLRVSIDATDTNRVSLSGASTTGSKQIELRGSLADLPRMVDTISQATIAQLLPHRAKDRWPPLSLSASDAKEYAAAAAAIRRRDWTTALSSAKAVVQRSPDFGPARLLLAQVLSRQGESKLANEQLVAARTHLKPLTPDAEQIQEAYRLSITTGFASEAADAYTALATRYPERVDFSIAQAETLTRAMKPDVALKVLSRPEWSQKTRSIRIRQLIALAQTELTYGTPAMAEKHAKQAIDLIGENENGWELDRGVAQLLLATANHSISNRENSSSMYEAAAQTFVSAGAHLDALEASFLAEITSQHNLRGDRRIKSILDEVRAAGDRGLEIKMMIDIAAFQHSRGEHIAARISLEKALNVANTVGDTTYRQTIEIKLSREDILAGNLFSAKRRLSLITKMGPLWAENQFRLAESEGTFHMLLGNYDESTASLSRPILNSRRQAVSRSPRAIARTECLLGNVFLRKGDLASARRQLEKCRYAPSGTLMRAAATLEASIELLAGNDSRAMQLTTSAEKSLYNMQESADRQIYELSIADTLVRLGEHDRAERIYLEIIALAQKSNYQLLVANAETGLSEIAAVHRKWEESKRLAASARRRVPVNLWAIHHRLDQLDLVYALTQSDKREMNSIFFVLKDKAKQHNDLVVEATLRDFQLMTTKKNNQHSLRKSTEHPNLRGASLGWLITPQNMTVDTTSMSALPLAQK